MREVLEELESWTAAGNRVAIGDRGPHPALGAAAAGGEDGDQRGRRGRRRGHRRLREGVAASACWRPGGAPELGRLAAPIGLDLGATSPEETALSILAEVVAVRNGHEGRRLGSARGRIHEVGDEVGA